MRQVTDDPSAARGRVDRLDHVRVATGRGAADDVDEAARDGHGRIADRNNQAGDRSEIPSIGGGQHPAVGQGSRPAADDDDLAIYVTAPRSARIAGRWPAFVTRPAASTRWIVDPATARPPPKT